MVSIVIPAVSIRKHNKEDLENLLNCIEPEHYKAVVCCFDGSDIDFVDYFREKFKFITSLHNRGNMLKFSRNSNVGLRYVRDVIKDSDGVFLVNQDTLIPKFKYMEQVIGSGLATPTTTPDKDLDNQPANVVRNQLNNKFPFFCPWFSMELIHDVGLLDEDLPVLFSDDAMILRTILHGKHQVENINIKIHHKGSHLELKEGWESGSGTYQAQDLPLGLLQYKLKFSVPQDIEHDKIIPWYVKNRVWKEEMKVV